MTNKYLCFFFLGVLISSCTTISYLPTSDKIGTNRFGSYIDLSSNNGDHTKGELIAIDSTSITILSYQDTTEITGFQRIKNRQRDSISHALKLNKPNMFLHIVPIKTVKGFSLRYATGKDYTWSILLGMLLSLSHGIYALGSLPINTIATGSITDNGINAFSYNNKTISYTKLKMFARFPQGIPPNVDLNKIR